MLLVLGRRVKEMIRLQPEQVWTCNVTLHVHICSGRNRIIPLMRRPNTDSTPKKPVTLPRNQLLIRYAGTSPVYTVTIRCYDTQQRYKCVPTLSFWLPEKQARGDARTYSVGDVAREGCTFYSARQLKVALAEQVSCL